MFADLDFKYEHFFYVDLLRRGYLNFFSLCFLVLIYLKIRPPVDTTDVIRLKLY